MAKKPGRRRVHAKPLAVGIGLLALDAVTSADESVPVRYWAGGTCGNVLIALRYLGWKTQPIARLAEDRATDLLLEDLRRWGVSGRYIRVEEEGSTPIIVHRIVKNVDGKVNHYFSWRCTSCGARYPGYKPERVTIAETIVPKLRRISVFFFDRVSAAALVLAKAAAESGALVVFEPSGIGNPILFRQAWTLAHVVKYSHERLEDFPELEIETNPLLVIETLGDAGLRYRWRRPGKRVGTWVDSRAIVVDDLKDTAGAGDWCTAGFLSRVAAKGYSGFVTTSDEQIRDAIRYGQALAAWNCRFEGARGGMYAVSKNVFRKQTEEILSGCKNVIHVTKGPSARPTAAASVCRVCDYSAAHCKKKNKKAK